MHPLLRSKAGKSLAIQADAVVTDQIRILTGLHAIGREINLTVILVHPEHLAHIPFSFSNLIIRLCRSTVIHIKMIPVITLAHPYHPLAVFQVITEAAGIVHILITGLLYQRTHLSRLGRKFQHPVHLMPALVILESNGTAVIVPFGPIHLILPVKQFGGRNNGPPVLHLIDARNLKGKFISRLRILLFVKLGL